MPRSRKVRIKNTVLFVLAICVFTASRSPTRWAFAAACLGALLGTQVGTVLDALSKRFRIIGGVVLAWDAYGAFIAPPPIPSDASYYGAAFWWGYGFLSAFPISELAIFDPGRSNEEAPKGQGDRGDRKR